MSPTSYWHVALLAAFTLFSSFLAPSLGAQDGLGTGFIDREGKPRLSGNVLLEGDKIIVVEPTGVKVPIDPKEVILLEFKRPAPNKPAAPVPAWKHAVVGQLVGGASANVNNDGVELFTTEKASSEPVPSFSMVSVPAPAIGQITARATKIENRVSGAYAGLILRDGTGLDSRSVMLDIRPTDGVMMRHWKSASLLEHANPRLGIRYHDWVRIVHDGKNVLGLISHDGNLWRRVWSVPESFAAKERIFGLVAGSDALQARDAKAALAAAEAEAADELKSLQDAVAQAEALVKAHVDAHPELMGVEPAERAAAHAQ